MPAASWKTALLLVAVLSGCHSSLPRPHPVCQRVENRYGDVVDHVGQYTVVSDPQLNHRVTRHYAGIEHAQEKKYYQGPWATLCRWAGWY